MKYKTIVIDPPWPYKNAGDKNFGIMPCKRAKKDDEGKYLPGSKGHHNVNMLTYNVLTVDDIERLPINKLAAEVCHLYLWVTNNFIEQGYQLIHSWGFDKKSFLTWGKVKRNSIIPAMGMGYYFRNSTEHIIFAIRGSTKLARRDQSNLLLCPRGEHSSKPELFFDIVERVSPRPRLELFARAPRKGWDVWSNQVRCSKGLENIKI